MKWTVQHSTLIQQDRFIHLRVDRCLTPAGATIEKYYVLDYPDWVNIVALTPQGNCVLVQQYRHGTGEVLHGLPAGGSETMDTNILEVAKRELFEETGYRAEGCLNVLSARVNPASHTNRVHTLLMLNAWQNATPELDPTEETRVVEVPFQDLFYGTSTVSSELQVMHQAAIWAAGLHLIRNPALCPPLLHPLQNPPVKQP